jgi:hypothetical protein
MEATQTTGQQSPAINVTDETDLGWLLRAGCGIPTTSAAQNGR